MFLLLLHLRVTYNALQLPLLFFFCTVFLDGVAKNLCLFFSNVYLDLCDQDRNYFVVTYRIIVSVSITPTSLDTLKTISIKIVLIAI